MDNQEIANILGWDEKLVQILITIARNNGITAGELSNVSGFDRGFIYRTLDTLKNAGFVKTTETNPICISLVDGEEIMQGLELKINDEATQKVDAYLFLVHELENMRSKSTIERSEFTVIGGTDNIWPAIAKKIKLAKETVVLLVSGDEFYKMRHSAIYDVIENSTCKITIVTDEGKYDIRKSENFNIIVNTGSIMGRILLVDDQYLIFSGSTMKLYRDPNDTCILTNDIGIVNQYKELLKNYLPISSRLQKEKKIHV